MPDPHPCAGYRSHKCQAIDRQYRSHVDVPKPAICVSRPRSSKLLGFSEDGQAVPKYGIFKLGEEEAEEDLCVQKKSGYYVRQRGCRSETWQSSVLRCGHRLRERDVVPGGILEADFAHAVKRGSLRLNDLGIFQRVENRV